MLKLLYPLAGTLMIVLPLGLAVVLVRRWPALPGWRWWMLGAVTFVLAQLGHLPFNWLADRWLKQTFNFAVWSEMGALVFTVLFLGLSASLWEELARYAMFRWWGKAARSWEGALLTGAGHGGVEAILLGALSLAGFFQMMALQGQDLAALVPPERLGEVQQQIATYWNVAWYVPLLGALERVFALTIQVSLAVLLVQTFLRGQRRWLWLAIGYHALVDAVALFFLQQIGLWVEGILALLALFSLWLIFYLQPSEQPAPVRVQASAPAADSLEPAMLDEALLEETKFKT